MSDHTTWVNACGEPCTFPGTEFRFQSWNRNLHRYLRMEIDNVVFIAVVPFEDAMRIANLDVMRIETYVTKKGLETFAGYVPASRQEFLLAAFRFWNHRMPVGWAFDSTRSESNRFFRRAA